MPPGDGQEVNVDEGEEGGWGWWPPGGPVLCPEVAAAAAVFQPRGNVDLVWPELLIFLNEKLEIWLFK